MDVLIFKTPEGYDVAIPEDHIATIWQAKTAGHCLIERIDDQTDIEVIHDFDKLVTDWFVNMDLRPVTPKTEVPPVKLDTRRKRPPRAKLKETDHR